MKKRPKILTIAGFDPSGGAGILADIKTFEQHKCLGFAVQTANTVQTENKFISVNWIEDSLFKSQLDHILLAHQFEVVKIGLISAEQLHEVCQRPELANSKLIWDPVLTASAGFNFNHNLSAILDHLKKISLITPNSEETIALSDESDWKKGAQKLASNTNLLVTGGHHLNGETGVDYLFIDQKTQRFNPKTGAYYSKHGSGCIYSSAIAANIVKGYPLQKSILKAKRYVEQVLKSNKNLLGFHQL